MPPTPDLTARQPQYGSPFDVVVIASSAGGVAALSSVLSQLPGTFPASVLVVQHLDPRHETLLAEILSRRTPLPVRLATDGEAMSPGNVYIAPPNRHLLVRKGNRLGLSDAELVHFVRPSADLLFESVAATYGDRVVGVVLTGSGSDASMGVRAVKERGGTVIVEDPESAQFSGMPRAAIESGGVDFVLPLAEIPEALVALVMPGDEA